MGNYKKSIYTIVICVDNVRDKYLLIHGYTGAIDVVSKEVASLFFEENMDVPLPDNLTEELFQTLIKRGYITMKNIQEEYLIANKIAASVHLYQRQNIKRFYFIVNYNCNFRCPYCYENLISNKGKSWSKQIMTYEMADKVFQCMEAIEPDKNKHSKEIILYGGEPLMKDNVEIINYIVRKGSFLGYNFNAISNGYDLELFENLLGKGLIEKLQITLDGDEKYHNKRRFHYKHGGSFSKIINNIQLALNKGVYVRVRSNIDKNNIESVKKLLEEFKTYGFYNYKNFSFYPALLENHATSLINSSLEKHLDFLPTCDFEEISNLFLKRKGDYALLISHAINNKKPIYLQPTHCGANKGIYIFDPVGDIYSCLEVIGMEGQVIGHYDNGLTWTKQYESWKGRSVNKIPECSKCRYALICGGGCSARDIEKGLNTPNCNNFPIVLELNARKAYQEIGMKY